MESSSGSGVPPPTQHSGPHHSAFWPQHPADAGWDSLTLTLSIIQLSVQPFIWHLLSSVAPGGCKLRVSNVPSSQLLPLHADILASLFTPEGQPYLLEVYDSISIHSCHIEVLKKTWHIYKVKYLKVLCQYLPGDVCHAWAVRPPVCPDRDGDLLLIL